MNRLKAYAMGVTDAVEQKGHLSSGMTWDEEEVPQGAVWNGAYDRGANLGEAVWPVIAVTRSTIATVRSATHNVRNLLP